MNYENTMNNITLSDDGGSSSGGGDDGNSQRELTYQESERHAERIREKDAALRAARHAEEQDEEPEDDEQAANTYVRTKAGGKETTLDDIEGFGTGGSSKSSTGFGAGRTGSELDEIEGFGTGGNAKKHEGGSFSL